ncbi:MAG: hypothetical protein ACKVX9_17350 [Blastocatellia bacterium]
MKRPGIMIGLAISLAIFAISAAAQSYEFAVEHEHMLRDCRGTLIIGPDKVEYKTNYNKDARVWNYNELRQIKVESPARIELITYEDQLRMAGRDRAFKFKILAGAISAEASALLMEKAAHPLVTGIISATEKAPTFEIAVKHLHRLGGCEGTLRIYPDRVVYESKEMSSDSRFWRYADIQNFSQSERFRFEVASFEDKFGGPKAYNFQLREELPGAVYDYLWARVYPSKFRLDPYEGREFRF